MTSGLKPGVGVVHAVSYSLLLLNTDLHVADLTTRMSRRDFVHNTLTAIQTQLQPAPLSQLSNVDLTYDDCSSVRGSGSDGTETVVNPSVVRSKRSGSIASWNSVSRDVFASSPVTSHYTPNGSTPSVQSPISQGLNSNSATVAYGRNWESDMENLLKVSCLRLPVRCRLTPS